MVTEGTDIIGVRLGEIEARYLLRYRESRKSDPLAWLTASDRIAAECASDFLLIAKSQARTITRLQAEIDRLRGQ